MTPVGRTRGQAAHRPASRPHVDRSAALRSGAIPIDSAVMGGRRTRAGAYAAAG